jgi:hypothetical protein
MTEFHRGGETELSWSAVVGGTASRGTGYYSYCTTSVPSGRGNDERVLHAYRGSLMDIIYEIFEKISIGYDGSERKICYAPASWKSLEVITIFGQHV